MCTQSNFDVSILKNQHFVINNQVELPARNGDLDPTCLIVVLRNTTATSDTTDAITHCWPWISSYQLTHHDIPPPITSATGKEIRPNWNLTPPSRNFIYYWCDEIKKNESEVGCDMFLFSELFISFNSTASCAKGLIFLCEHDFHANTQDVKCVCILH